MTNPPEHNQRREEIRARLRQLSRSIQPGDAVEIVALRAELAELVKTSRRDRMLRSAERRAEFAERRAIKLARPR